MINLFIILNKCVMHIDVVCCWLGAEYGLSLTLNLEEYENILGVSTISGIKVWNFKV
jgi:hypothetical protein